MSLEQVSPAPEGDQPSQHLNQLTTIDPAMPPPTDSAPVNQEDDDSVPMEDDPQSPVASSSSHPPNPPSPSSRCDPAMPPPLARPASPTPAEIEAEATRKRQRAVVADEGKKRGRRMFGLLQSTLKQAQSETAKPKSGAAKKREELEHKLADKLSREREEGAAKAKVERERRELKATINRIEDNLANADSIYRNRHDAKLHLAGFLCTTFKLTAPAPASDGVTVPFAPRLPHALRLSDPKALKPVYYLPYRLLPSQEDQIEDQIAAVRKAVRIEREDVDDARQPRLKELAAAREQLSALHQRTAAARRPSESRPGPARRGSEVDMDRPDGGRRRDRSRSRSRSRERSASAKEGGMEVDRAGSIGRRATSPLPAPGGDDVAMAAEGADVELEY